MEPPRPDDATPVPKSKAPELQENVTPDPTNKVPELPLLAVPVLTMSMPLIPFVPALAVCTKIVPDVLVELYPLLIEIWPPVALAEVVPAEKTI